MVPVKFFGLTRKGRVTSDAGSNLLESRETSSMNEVKSCIVRFTRIECFIKRGDFSKLFVYL